MFKYFDEFYKTSLYHFIVSAICAALFALGLEYSRGEDGDDVVDYFISSIVLSSIQFVLSIVTLLLFALTRGCPVAVGTFGSKTESHYRRLKSIHGILSIVSFVWGFAGSIMTAVSGICKKQDKCSYAVNFGINRTLAIIIIVIHVMNVAVSYIFLTTSRSKTRTTPFTAKSKTKVTGPSDIEAISQNSKSVQNIQIGLTKLKKDPQIDNKIRLKKQRSLEIIRKPRENVSHDEYYDDGPVGNKKNKNPRVNDIPLPEPKPLPKKKNKHLFSAVGKVVFHYTETKNKRATNTNYRDARLPSVAPPSYNDVTSTDADGNPYWLPPLPQDHREIHRLPDNMYIGNSYPDTEIVAIQANDIARR